MAAQRYTASLSQSQDRSGYSIIFRHPARRDQATGRFGLRVRRGLGTRDEGEALRLRDELNELLGNTKYHDANARAEAELRFDARVVEMFFDKLAPVEVDFGSLRDQAIPLPPSEPDGYRRILLLGTTGAGKTTLVRQLIGTDPRSERFPSTSTAKTTTHDSEIILDDGPWRAVVTFSSIDEVREYLNECLSAAVLAAHREADDSTVLRRLLNHVNQRFRLSYVLGNGPASSTFELEEDDNEGEADDVLIDGEDSRAIDLAATTRLLTRTLPGIRELARRLGSALRLELKAQNSQDERVVEELFEEELDSLLREDDEFHELADALMDEIEKRFDLLPSGAVTKTRQGWPLSWSREWPVESRHEFFTEMARFSSNQSALFGRLLTPLVNGVRVSGPFRPEWAEDPQPRLVILDGEGLGHTPTSAASVSTTVSRRIEQVDAVVLVDSAAQPMQAAPLAIIREVVAAGNARKLLIAFTHFDEVEGDNLPTAESKAQHVLASGENALNALGEELGPYGERSFRKRLEDARFFLGDLDERLSQEKGSGRRTIKQLQRLLQAVDATVERPPLPKARPMYDRVNLVLAVRSAAASFHDVWRPRLGLEEGVGIPKEHWSRVKALSRRLATGMADEYDSLRPVADVRKELLEQAYVFIQNPLGWEGAEPPEEGRQAVFDDLAERIGKGLLGLSTRRLWRERAAEWQGAYDKRGTGSTFVRARIIGDQIYEPAVPVPTVAPSPDRNQFLQDVIDVVQGAVTEVGGILR